MKKAISVIISFCIVLSISLTAFGAENPKSQKIEAQTKGAADYLTYAITEFTAEQAVEYLSYSNSAKDMSSYDDAFLQSVKDNLDANGGRLIIYGSESMVTYASVIQILDNLGKDATDFYGYNLEELMLSMDASAPLDNPYYYKTIIPAAHSIDGAESFARQLCDTFISTYYVMGEGMNYWGYGCDNTANFIAALSVFADDYREYLDDAFTVLETYKVNGGYCYNTI